MYRYIAVMYRLIAVKNSVSQTFFSMHRCISLLYRSKNRMHRLIGFMYRCIAAGTSVFLKIKQYVSMQTLMYRFKNPYASIHRHYVSIHTVVKTLFFQKLNRMYRYIPLMYRCISVKFLKTRFPHPRFKPQTPFNDNLVFHNTSRLNNNPRQP